MGKIFSSPATILVTVIVGLAIMAGIMYSYQREGTNGDTKYLYRTSTEIDATYNDPLVKVTEGPNYSDNLAPHSTGLSKIILGSNPDFDHDGLINAQETALGTDINDPDTDSDGTSDGIEAALGTNPLDVTSGNLTFPPLPTPLGSINITPDRLSVGSFAKLVRNLTQNQTTWATYTTARPGESVAFLIPITVTNPSTDQTFSGTVSDILGHNLQYTKGSGYIRVGNMEPQPLPDNWVEGYPISISPTLNPQKPVAIEITFNAVLVPAVHYPTMVTWNQATLTINAATRTATAFIKISLK